MNVANKREALKKIDEKRKDGIKLNHQDRRAEAKLKRGLKVVANFPEKQYDQGGES